MEKVIVFDFDGTLTQKGANVWKTLWEMAGYPTGEGSTYRNLFRDYINGEYSYQKWCDLTCEYFRKGNLNSIKVSTTGAILPRIKGIKNTLEVLKSKGYDLFIVSGSIKQIIKSYLKENINYFTGIYANNFNYDNNGIIESITATPFDFDGKKVFIEHLINSGIKKENIIFIGNSYNDEKVSSAGVKTICINPETKNFNDKSIWHKAIISESLSKILPEIINENENIK